MNNPGASPSRRRPALVLAVVAVAVALLVPGAAAAGSGGPGDPVAPLLLALAVILLSAKLAGALATRLHQPSVLGELLAGVVLGNLPLVGVTRFEALKAEPTLAQLARLGALLLLFEVGLESTVAQMLEVGLSSLLVASIGVVAPFALGWGVGAVFLPGASAYAHAFLGAALAATSVGITARVLSDLGRSSSREARVILGAAVIDDVFGLVILAVLTAMIGAADRGGAMSWGAAGLVVAKAVGFLAGAFALGVRLAPRLFRLASKLEARGALLAVGLSLCFLVAWAANAVGLAPIVGAFAAGLVLEATHYRDFTDRGELGLPQLVRPITAFLTPIFFVLMGLRTDLRAFAQPGVLGLAAALTVAAIVGKQGCGLGALGKGIDRVSVGLGMIPRGEVGLIFASVGATLTIGGEPVVSPSTFSALVGMVLVTTLVTPPALKWSLARHRG